MYHTTMTFDTLLKDAHHSTKQSVLLWSSLTAHKKHPRKMFVDKRTSAPGYKAEFINGKV